MLKIIRPLATHLRKVIRPPQRVLYYLRRLRNHLDELVDKQKTLLFGQPPAEQPAGR
ncbi:hypothetical protein ACWENR_30495 [Micromonospora sp. NPDC004336]